ncbi:MAG: hypothetical protein ACYC46_16355 [Acidobacteriaceae bacterium]
MSRPTIQISEVVLACGSHMTLRAKKRKHHIPEKRPGKPGSLPKQPNGPYPKRFGLWKPPAGYLALQRKPASPALG